MLEILPEVSQSDSQLSRTISLRAPEFHQNAFEQFLKDVSTRYILIVVGSSLFKATLH